MRKKIEKEIVISNIKIVWFINYYFSKDDVLKQSRG